MVRRDDVSPPRHTTSPGPTSGMEPTSAVTVHAGAVGDRTPASFAGSWSDFPVACAVAEAVALPTVTFTSIDPWEPLGTGTLVLSRPPLSVMAFTVAEPCDVVLYTIASAMA